MDAVATLAKETKSPPHPAAAQRNSRRQRIIIAGLIFLSAFGVRLLVWQNKRTEVPQVQTRVTENYKHLARLLQQNGLASFFDSSSTTSNPDLLGHPPGYSILLALIYRLAGETDLAAQLFQMICDSLAAVMIFLIAIELLPSGVGIIAGFMAAFAPQFSWNSVLLLPDTLAALPILVAIYLITRARQRGRWSLDEPLYGSSGKLESLDFVTLIMEVEERKSMRIRNGNNHRRRKSLVEAEEPLLKPENLD